jgi:peptidoglycan-associated lipoprotein
METEDVTTSAIEKAIFELKDALFDFDRYNIRSDARAVLDSVASWLNKNRDINVLIEGHCDERGTNEYNLALGEKRANATKDYLVSKGIAPSRMNTLSYGEERPACTAQNENCWQKNRRAHFVVTR